MKISTALAALPSFTSAELSLLRAAIDTLLPQQADDVDATTPLYDAMTTLIGVGLPYRDFKNTASYRAWRKHAPACLAFIGKTFPQTATSKLGMIAMMTLLLGALRDDLKARKIPVTLGTMSMNLGSIPEVLDAQFPDYIANGMAHLIYEARVKKLKPLKHRGPHE